MKGTRICKICGREYKYCKTFRNTGMFRWQDVACSPEHGAAYFAEIAASRGQTVRNVAINDYSEDEDFDALFEEEFDDDEQELEIEK